MRLERVGFSVSAQVLVRMSWTATTLQWLGFVDERSKGAAAEGTTLTRKEKKRN